MSHLSPVTFHGDTIFCIDYQNQPYTPMRPIVENMGLAWAAQSVKLNSNKARWGVSIIEIPTASGQQCMLCMPVRKLPAYLATITPKKVRPELRAKIELYQNESDNALWDYWTKGQATRGQESSSAASSTINNDSSRPSRRTDPERKALTAIINTWVGMAPIHYASARAQVNAHFGVASVDSLTIGQVREAIQWVQGKIDAIQPDVSTTCPALTSHASVYADKVKAFIDLEERFTQFSGETRRKLSEFNSEYVRLNQGNTAAMLRTIPNMTPGSMDRLINAFASQPYDGYNWIEEGLSRMRLAIVTARAVSRVIAG